MKKILSVLVLLVSLTAFSQEDEVAYSPKDLDTPPECPTTMNEFKMCVAKNVAIPHGVQAGVFNLEVSFIVEKNGTLTAPGLVKDPGNGLNEAVVKAFHTCAKQRWVAGRLKGKKVRTKLVFLLTLKFRDE